MSIFGSHFSAHFSVCDDCILKSTTAWLLKLSVLYSHSFMHVHNTTFQIKTVFNNVLFSTEMHNPLPAHLLALSHISLNFYPVSVYVTVLTSFPGNDPYLAYTVSIYVLPSITESVSVTVLASFFYGPYIYYIYIYII